MKKIGLNILMGIILATMFASCLGINNDDENQPTAEEEKARLEAYIDKLVASGNDVDTTDLGVYYVITEEGEGELAQNGDTLTVGYAGYLIDGYLFDTSVWHNSNDSTWSFVLNNPPNIPGFDDALKIMKKGAKGEFIVPSSLAYGAIAQGRIPAYSSLIFVIKMEDIKPAVEQ